MPITEIILRQATCRVYNLAVEGLRNYAVGPNSVLAHNMCAAAANAAKMAVVREKGNIGEVAAGITGPKRGILGPLSGKMRFPDQHTGVLVKESKNVARQGWTAQLKDYAAIAKNEGIPFELWVRESTRLSRPLQAAREAGDVIIKYLPGL